MAIGQYSRDKVIKLKLINNILCLLYIKFLFLNVPYLYAVCIFKTLYFFTSGWHMCAVTRICLL